MRFEIRVKNHEEEERRCALRFRASEGVELEPGEAELVVGASATATCQVRARFPTSFKTHSLTLVADVAWNGRRLGEIAEAVAYW